MFRTVLFWMHLTAALLVGIVVVIMSITGVILTYEKQMLLWADARAAGIEAPAPTMPRARLAAVVDRVTAAAPAATITTVTRRHESDAPVAVALNNGTILLVHPYTGEIIREAPTTLRRVFRTATEWHRYLAGRGDHRATGKAITGASNLAFLFLVLSGMYLWLPRRWTRAATAAVALPRWRHPNGKARDFNWHNALGIWSAVPLAIVVASATVISYPWAGDLAYRVVGDSPPPRPTAPSAGGPSGRAAAPPPEPLRLPDLDTRWQVAERQVGNWRAIALRVPARANAPLVFTIDAGWAGQPQKRGTLTLDGSTGQLVRWEVFAEQSRGRQFRSMLRFAHTGEYWGLTGQTVAGLVSSTACVLVCTGFALAWRRFSAWRQRLQSRRQLERAA